MKPRVRVQLSRGQWTILGMVLTTMLLEFAFSPYWHEFYASNIVVKDSTGRSVKITTEGLAVAGFMVFGLFGLVLLGSVAYRAAFSLAGLLLLAVLLARTQPMIDWMDATTAALKKASGA